MHDTTLYAKWEIIPPSSFTVGFDTNGGTMIETQTVATNDLLSKPVNPVNRNQVFAGWYQESTFENLWDFGFNKVNKDMTLYAKWKEKINFNETFKVLSIGNSFSEDAHRYLWEIAKSYGIPEENIVVANMYIGGAELQQHVNNSVTDLTAYEYQKFASSEVVKTNGRLSVAIKDEDWDVITIQQVSQYSGVVSYYQDYVRRLTTWIETNATNPAVMIGWHMTWAYQSTSSHSGFAFYGKNQMTMYQQIQSVLNQKIKTIPQINLIIPAGTAIQNARTSYLGDTFTRDGYHLSDPLGRYIAGLMYFKAITGFKVSLETIVYKPDGVSDTEQLLAYEAVNHAYLNPFEVTQSSFLE